MSPGAKLSKLLAGDRIVLGGGAHDALSARIGEQLGGLDEIRELEKKYGV